MSFGEFVFSIGFIQKTVKVDLDVRLNRAYPQQKQPQKVPEVLRGLHTEAEGEAPAGPTYRSAGPWGPHVSPPFLCRFSTAS